MAMGIDSWAARKNMSYDDQDTHRSFASMVDRGCHRLHARRFDTSPVTFSANSFAYRRTRAPQSVLSQIQRRVKI
jgi:hypothetical protein